MLFEPSAQTIFYAIGDIHGCAVKLKALMGDIREFHTFTYPDRPQQIICLGDYVDRGPDSKAVIEFLIEYQRENPDQLVCLMGNHEEMLLAAHKGDVRATTFWEAHGGLETLASYGIPSAGHLPNEHVEWLKNCPAIYQPEGHDLVFVHAGVHPINFPNEDSSVWLWTRSRRFFDTTYWDSPALANKTVIHGHTPNELREPEVTPDGRRINIDTGAAFGGRLTAVAIDGSSKPVFLHA